MLTLVFDCAATALKLAFALFAFWIARTDREQSAVRRAAWSLTGLAFLMAVTGQIVQSYFQIKAFFAGPGMAVYESYLRWAPAANHSRTLLAIVFGILLGSLALSRWWQKPAASMLAAAALVAGMVFGAALGWAEGSLIQARHFTNAASLDVIELLVMLGALILAAARDTTDRYLWLCLAIYSVRGALHTVSLAALAWDGVEDAWAPQPWVVQFHIFVAYVAISGLALRRLVLARRGVTSPAVLASVDRTHPLTL